MAVRIVHFGVDTKNQIAALKNAGYRVDECSSLAQLHAALVGIWPADAVVIAENDGAALGQAISLTRASSTVPLILFQNGNHYSNPAEFDLVIPQSIESCDWLSDIAKLMDRGFQRDR
jgi:hypothetical protein